LIRRKSEDGTNIKQAFNGFTTALERLYNGSTSRSEADYEPTTV
jgi:hypothetical protein